MTRFSDGNDNFLGTRLRSIRLQCGFTQQDVADALNVSRSTYSYYELGTTRPDPSVLGKLAEYYNIDILFFYDENLPVDAILADADGRRRRTSRVGKRDPKKVGDLRPDERSLIMFLRSDNGMDPKELLELLEKGVLKKLMEKGQED